MRAGRHREPRPAAAHPRGVGRDAGARRAARRRPPRRAPRAPPRHALAPLGRLAGGRARRRQHRCTYALKLIAIQYMQQSGQWVLLKKQENFTLFYNHNCGNKNL